MTEVRHKVLVLSTREWFGSARLPRALVRAGFEVSSLSFPEALITKARAISARFVLPEAASDAELLLAIRETITRYAPDFVVPGDDPAVELVHALAAELADAPADDPTRLCLRRSLGDPRHYADVQSRRGLHRIASELGVRAPEQGVVKDLAEAEAFAARHGLPLVLKAENSCAGFGTSICKDQAALAAGFRYFDARFGRRGQTKSELSVQRFIQGRVAMRLVVALDGEVLGGMSAIKVETHPAPTGPSTVVDFFEHAEMERTASVMTRAFGLSGFGSFDFIVEDGTDLAYLIELNPRPTPICHLGGAFGDDLAGLLWQRLAGTPPRESVARHPQKRVALFPQEWIRDTTSPHFAAAFHDVPWEDPDLLRALVLNGHEQLGWRRMFREEDRRPTIRRRFGGDAAQEGSE